MRPHEQHKQIAPHSSQHPLSHTDPFSHADPHGKIDNKYSTMAAHNYKSLIEKDVLSACRTGLAALQPVAVATQQPKVAADPFADYLNSIAPTRSKSDVGGGAAAVASPLPTVRRVQTVEMPVPASPAAPPAAPPAAAAPSGTNDEWGATPVLPPPSPTPSISPHLHPTHTLISPPPSGHTHTHMINAQATRLCPTYARTSQTCPRPPRPRSWPGWLLPFPHLLTHSLMSSPHHPLPHASVRCLTSPLFDPHRFVTAALRQRCLYGTRATIRAQRHASPQKLPAEAWWVRSQEDDHASGASRTRPPSRTRSRCGG